MKIKINTSLDENLNDFLDKKYCKRCKIPREPGCCCGCVIEIDFEIIKKPIKFVK